MSIITRESLPPMRTLLNFMLGFGLLLGGIALAQETYTIKPGDSLARIARMHNCSVDALAKENNLKLSTIIHPGQVLRIPARTGAGAAPATAAGGTHTIQPGDTFTAISRRYNIPVEELLAANPNMDPRALRPGQNVRLTPAKASPAPAPQPESVPRRDPAAEPSPDSKEAESAPDDEDEETKPTQATVVMVAIDTEITFGEFAKKHGTDIKRLNELNGFDLTSSTPLAKGSELYVPVQP